MFDRGTRTFNCGMDHGKTMPFDEISHLALRQASGILWAIEVHSKHAARPLITRVRLTRPSADTLASLAAEVAGVHFTPPDEDARDNAVA